LKRFATRYISLKTVKNLYINETYRELTAFLRPPHIMLKREFKKEDVAVTVGDKQNEKENRGKTEKGKSELNSCHCEILFMRQW